MGDDPRDKIEVNGLVCERNNPDRDEFWIRDASYEDNTVADWGVIVAFATSILAADAEWKRSLKPCDCPCSGVACDEYADVHNYLACGHCGHWRECHAKEEK